tara:strand:- start:959 stop:1561 length:603 start_codon:yes stop_codon:yes gene_type:complete
MGYFSCVYYTKLKGECQEENEKASNPRLVSSEQQRLSLFFMCILYQVEGQMSRVILRNFSDRSRSSLVDGVPIFTNPVDFVRFALFEGSSEVNMLASYKRVEGKNAVMDRLNLEGSSVIFHVCIIPSWEAFVKRVVHVFESILGFGIVLSACQQRTWGLAPGPKSKMQALKEKKGGESAEVHRPYSLPHGSATHCSPAQS